VLEYVADAPKKSNEEICAEIWAGKWGTGNDRKTRLTNAGYDYNTIQRMVDAGVGKPQPKPQPQPAPQKPTEAPKPEEPKEDTSKPAEAPQKGSDDVKEPIEEASSEPTTLDNGNTSLENKNKDKNTEAQDEGASAENNLNENEGEKMENANKEEEKVFEPIEADAQLIQSVIEEAGSFFQPSDKTKLVVYIVIDILLGVGLLIPEITNIVLANTMALKASFASTALIKLGVYLALVFKLIKKKK
jgi:DNA mismatch repair ATPase MutL